MATFVIKGLNKENKETEKTFRLPKNVTNADAFTSDIQRIYNAFALANAVYAHDFALKKMQEKGEKDAEKLKELKNHVDCISAYVENHGGSQTPTTANLAMLIAWTSLNCRKYGRTNISFKDAGTLATMFKVYCNPGLVKDNALIKAPTKDLVKKSIVQFVTYCIGDCSAYGKTFNIRITDAQLDDLKAWFLGHKLKYDKIGIHHVEHKTNDIIEQIVLSVLKNTFGFDTDAVTKKDNNTLVL